jgi:hypothetical protein
LTANSDRLSHFGRRLSLFLQTLVFRGIFFREHEHRQERIGLGMTLWPTGPTKVEEENEIDIGNLHESGGAHSGLHVKPKSRCERKMSYEQKKKRA